MSTADVITSLVRIAACVTSPVFLCVSVFLTVLYLKHTQEAQESQLALTSLYLKCKRDTVESEQALTRKVATLARLVEDLERDTWRVSRDEWLKRIGRTDYRNEIEVEVKFIHPLLSFLGYDGNDFEIRVPVTVRVGRKQTRAEADWVIWKAAAKGQRRAAVIIEAKVTGQSLDTTVQEQARSYAFGLNAPVYVLTNGRRLQVFRRGIQHDDCIVDCDVSDLLNSWGSVEQAIGASACLARLRTAGGAG